MIMAKPTRNWLWMAMPMLVACLGGCKGYDLGMHHFFDASKNIRPPDQPQVNPIFDTIGPTDQTEMRLPGSVEPTAEDLQYVETDYVMGPTDVVRIHVLDLLADGVETILERQVSHSGFIDLPLLTGRVKAAGLTNTQLVEAIKDAYRPDILKDPNL